MLKTSEFVAVKLFKFAKSRLPCVDYNAFND